MLLFISTEFSQAREIVFACETHTHNALCTCDSVAFLGEFYAPRLGSSNIKWGPTLPTWWVRASNLPLVNIPLCSMVIIFLNSSYPNLEQCLGHTFLLSTLRTEECSPTRYQTRLTSWGIRVYCPLVFCLLFFCLFSL